MPHYTPLIGTIVAGLVMAFFMGVLARTEDRKSTDSSTVEKADGA